MSTSGNSGTAPATDWGTYNGLARKPCPEDPVALTGAPIGMYHCPYCGMMVLAARPHPAPWVPQEAKDHPLYPLDDYEGEYGQPWPLGYEASDAQASADDGEATADTATVLPPKETL